MAAADVNDDNLIEETILNIYEKGIPMDAVRAGKDKLERNQRNLYGRMKNYTMFQGRIKWYYDYNYCTY